MAKIIVDVNWTDLVWEERANRISLGSFNGKAWAKVAVRFKDVDAVWKDFQIIVQGQNDRIFFIFKEILITQNNKDSYVTFKNNSSIYKHLELRIYVTHKGKHWTEFSDTKAINLEANIKLVHKIANDDIGEWIRTGEPSKAQNMLLK